MTHARLPAITAHDSIASPFSPQTASQDISAFCGSYNNFLIDILGASRPAHCSPIAIVFAAHFKIYTRTMMKNWTELERQSLRTIQYYSDRRMTL